jgi:predicted secreted protein
LALTVAPAIANPVAAVPVTIRVDDEPTGVEVETIVGESPPPPHATSAIEVRRIAENFIKAPFWASLQLNQVIGDEAVI